MDDTTPNHVKEDPVRNTEKPVARDRIVSKLMFELDGTDSASLVLPADAQPDLLTLTADTSACRVSDIIAKEFATFDTTAAAWKGLESVREICGETAKFAELTSSISRANLLMEQAHTVRATDSLSAILAGFRESGVTDILADLSATASGISGIRMAMESSRSVTDYLKTQDAIFESITSPIARIAASDFALGNNTIRLAESVLGDFSAAARASEMLKVDFHGITDSVAFLSAAEQAASPFLGAAASMLAVESRFASVNLLDDMRGIDLLRNDLTALSEAASGIWKDCRIASIAHDPLLWHGRSAIELYNAAQAAASVAVASGYEIEQDEELEAQIDDSDALLEARLVRLEPELVTAFRGGVEALERGGTDWQRHTMVSFREVATHVLHLLAPDKQLIGIAQPGDLVNGRPTRLFRLRYIFGGIANGSLVDFYNADMRSAIQLFDLLNGDTHRLGNMATAKQARYLKSRLTGLLLSLLEAREF